MWFSSVFAPQRPDISSSPQTSFTTTAPCLTRTSDTSSSPLSLSPLLDYSLFLLVSFLFPLISPCVHFSFLSSLLVCCPLFFPPLFFVPHLVRFPVLFPPQFLLLFCVWDVCRWWPSLFMLMLNAAVEVRNQTRFLLICWGHWQL